MRHDARVVPGCEPRRPHPRGEREQLREPKAPVARDAGIRRLATCVAAHKGLDDRAPELLAEIERHMGATECVTGFARRDHRIGGAACTLRARTLRVEPEPERHADGFGAGVQQRDGAVDATAHRHCNAPGIRSLPDGRPDRVRERVGRQRLARHRGCLQQREPPEVASQPGRIRVDDPVAVDAKPHERPFAVARRVSDELDHPSTVAASPPAHGRSEPGKPGGCGVGA